MGESVATAEAAEAAQAGAPQAGAPQESQPQAGAQESEPTIAVTDLLVEEVSIDGMCGVY